MLGQAPDGDADRDVQRIVHSDDHARDALEARGAADYPAWGEASRLLSVEGADRGSTHARAPKQHGRGQAFNAGACAVNSRRLRSRSVP